MVPAAAFATEAPEATEDASLELLASVTDQFKDGVITVSNDTTNLTAAGTTNIAASAVDATKWSVKIKPVNEASDIAVESDTTNYTVTWYKVDGTTATAVPKTSIKDAGKYRVTITAKAGTYKGAEASLDFTIGAKAFANNLTAYSLNKAGTVSDAGSTFTYSAEAQKIGFEDQGKSANAKVLKEGTDYTVEYFKGSSTTASEPIEAGTWTAHLTGLGDYEGSTKNVTFTIGKYDLQSTAYATAPADDKITVDDVSGVAATPSTNPVHPTTVNKSEALAKCFDLDYSAATVNSGGAGMGLGNYGAYASVKAVLNRAYYDNFKNDTDDITAANVASKATIDSIKFNKYAKEATFTFKGQAWPDEEENAKNPVVIVKGKSTVSLADFAVSVDGKALEYDADGTATDAKHYTVAITGVEPDGTTAISAPSVDTINTTAGTYTVVVAIEAGTNYDAAGGSKKIIIETKAGSYDLQKNGYLTLSSKPIDTSGAEITYDGTDYAEEFAGKIVAGSDTVTLATGDFTFKDAKGEDVTEVQNAGKYTVTVKQAGIEIENNTFELTIKPIEIKEVRINGSAYTTVNGEKALAFKDAAYDLLGGADAYLEYYAGDVNNNGKKDDADYAKVNTVGTFVKTTVLNAKGEEIAANAVKDEGTYTVKFEAVDADNPNYVVSVEPLTIKVAEAVKFIDVPQKNADGSDNWMYEPVTTADELGYMTGVGNRQFAPNEKLTRAQAATVLFKMAGNKLATNEGATSQVITYPTSYADVDATAWYAQAVQWAEQTGIVTGYEKGGKTVFEPAANVTRQQFALMLQRYAKSFGKDSAGDAAALASYTDAGAVATWATDGVSWAVKNKVMGVNTTILNPNGDIVRGEAAAMTVRYQPVALNVDQPAVDPDATYTVTVADIAKTDGTSVDGTVTVSVAKAKAGATLEVTATPKSTFKVDEVTVTGATLVSESAPDATDGKVTYTYTMPAQDVTVTATFVSAA